MSDPRERLTAAFADRYAIEREIGSGGMATVYLAEDLRHHRKVAVKVLRPELAAALGPERFLREIEIAAQLQHPNIVPLLDSGETDGFLYYVMPYVEGQSLRERLAREGALPIGDAIRIVRDVVDALTEAHAHGVVHRDIKPENILLRGHHALVTDFGVAKAVSEATGREKLTTAGVALGTPAYMAPEQAAADPHLDHRVDIYAVGAVAYELLTGRPVFMGTTSQQVLSAHMTEAPQPVTKHRDTVPAALEAVVMRCLEKRAADRWQSAEELLPQLEALTTPSGGMTPTATRPVVKTSGGRRWRVAGTLITATALLGVGVVLSRAMMARPLTITVSNIARVTNDPGLEFQPAISPDGEEVAYVVGPVDNPRIVVRSTRNLGSGGETRPAAEETGQLWLPSWTPDGAALRFYRLVIGGRWDWLEVGKLGGTVRTIRRPFPGNDVMSPDGQRVVASRGDSIFAYRAGSDELKLLGVQRVDPWTLHSFAWSPDGRWIAYVNGNGLWRFGANVGSASIWIISADGGEPILVTDRLSMNQSPQWLPDGRHLLFVSNRDGPRAVYVVAVGRDGPKGDPQSVPGVSDPHSISISADGRRLAYAKFAVTQNIWSVPIPRSGVVSVREAIPVTTGNQVIESHEVSPNDEWIAFDSDIRGEFDIYRRRLAGGPAQLVASLDGVAYAPAWSPDGSEIAFYGAAPPDTGGITEVYVVPGDGSGVPQRLTSFPGADGYPDWSSDGLKIAYHSQGPTGADDFHTWMVIRNAVGGPWGAPVPVTDFRCFGPRWVPNTEDLVCDAGRELIRVSLTGDVLLRYRLPAGLSSPQTPECSRDGSLVYFVGTASDGSTGLWRVPSGGGDPTKVVAFDDPSRSVLSLYSMDAGHIYLTVAEYESDIWVMDLEW